MGNLLAQDASYDRSRRASKIARAAKLHAEKERRELFSALYGKSERLHPSVELSRLLCNACHAGDANMVRRLLRDCAAEVRTLLLIAEHFRRHQCRKRTGCLRRDLLSRALALRSVRTGVASCLPPRILDVDDPGCPTTGNTPLFLASMNGHADIVDMLLHPSAGCRSLDKPNADGVTPLIIASSELRVDVVRALLAGGARAGYSIPLKRWGGHSALDEVNYARRRAASRGSASSVEAADEIRALLEGAGGKTRDEVHWLMSSEGWQAVKRVKRSAERPPATDQAACRAYLLLTRGLQDDPSGATVLYLDY
jgi:hypothetical protein